MNPNPRRTAAPLITTIQKLFSEDLAKENDFLRQENKLLRSKLGKRVPLTEADRRTLVRYVYYVKTHSSQAALSA
jgi:regulator of replication initiation timing